MAKHWITWTLVALVGAIAALTWRYGGLSMLKSAPAPESAKPAAAAPATGAAEDENPIPREFVIKGDRIEIIRQ